MRRDVRTARALAGRVAVLAAGVGAALGAGAGLASAATLPAAPAVPQIGDTSSFGEGIGALPEAPTLALGDGTSQAQSNGSASDPSAATGDALAKLPSNSLLSGLGSGGGNAD